jgi:DNA polymerase III sliding clamp (beta) subunit (PCNA family)
MIITRVICPSAGRLLANVEPDRACSLAEEVAVGRLTIRGLEKVVKGDEPEEGERLNVKQRMFTLYEYEIDKLKWLMAGASKDDAREMLRYIYITENGQTVSADGFRLHIVETPEYLEDYKGKFIKAEFVDKTRALITEQDAQGDFPNWENVMPKDDEVFQICANPAYIRSSLDRLASTGVRFRFYGEDKPMKIESENGNRIIVLMPMNPQGHY